MEKDYEIIITENGNKKSIYMTINRKKRPLRITSFRFVNNIIEKLYFLASTIIFWLFTLFLLLGIKYPNSLFSLYSGTLAIYLSICLKLLNKYPFYAYEINLWAIVLSIGTCAALYFLAPHITFSEFLNFLRIEYLGNTLGYVSLFISIGFSLRNNNKNAHRDYKINQQSN